MKKKVFKAQPKRLPVVALQPVVRRRVLTIGNPDSFMSKLQKMHTLLTCAMTSDYPCRESKHLDAAEELLNKLRDKLCLAIACAESPNDPDQLSGASNQKPK